ncbi:hypothetical protein SAMN05421747_10473 [Parapedobacter composti]|uniref:YhhN-like protein n=1 Tax=Parapedobacter composti TaxID=623281 RepID=A0A1I1GAT8_9SPHI|nr:hypothetical protein [Parapedobacter composti]SFC08654.1 hypothetical protein SAMN05421747_10473 [Parapedobacter composti]
MNAATVVLLGLMLIGSGIGFYRRKQLENPALRMFPYFLLFQFGYQLVASVYSFILTEHASNHFIFNLSLPINILYFGFLFHSLVQHRAKGNIVAIVTVLNLLFYFVNLFFIQGFTFFMTYSRTAMAVSLVLFSLLYFHGVITSDDGHKTNPVRNASFWIVTAVFFFYLSSTLTTIFWNYFVLNNTYFGSVMMRIFAFVLYTMYIVGILLHKPADDP